MRGLVVFVLAGLAAVCATGAPSRAEDATQAMLARLAAADPDLHTYRADVAFDVGLHTFPYLRRTLHGNAYFKRPARMELVFSDLPAIARSFSNVYVGLGTPSDWNRKFTIASAELRDGERVERYLVLTPRAERGRLREVDVFVDPAASLPSRIVWRYRDGRIEMQQRFARVEGHQLVVAQQADIHLPAVHAFVNATITNYALNVDVDDRVFSKRIGSEPPAAP